MISVRLKKFLDDNMVGYDVVQHDPAFTAQELAARMHVPGREFVKVVVVKMDGGYALAAVPAHRRVDLKGLAKVAGVPRCQLAGEADFQQFFPDCEVGAMPPFGNLYNLPTYVDQEVAFNEVIVINAGTHAEAIRLRYGDLKRLVHPRVGKFAVPPPIEVAARRPKPRKKAVPRARRKVARKGGAKKKATKKKAARKKPVRKKAGRRKKASRKKSTRRKVSRKKTRKARRAKRRR